MRFMMAFNSLLLFPLFFVAVFSDSDRCYSPNGDPADAVASCWDAVLGQTGLCCQPGDLCLNNTLCGANPVGNTLLYYRGSCLDRMWEDPTCPKFCLESGQSKHTLDIYPCNRSAGPERWYCDGDDPRDSCEPTGGSFELPDYIDAYATAGTKPEPSAVTSSAEKSSISTGDSTEDHDTTSGLSASNTIQPSLGPPADTTTESNSVQPSLGSPPLDNATETTSIESTSIDLSTSLDVPSSTLPASSPPLADTAVIPAPSTTPGPDADEPGSSTPTPSDTPQDDGKSSLAVPVGVGVAVGASVLIAASVLVFCYQRKRRRQAPVRAETPPPFEFEYINNQAPDWLGPSYGAKLPGTHGGNRYVPEVGGTARVELP